LERSAHKLKGSVGNFCSNLAFEQARQLELIGREGDLNEVHSVVVRLDDALEELTKELRELSNGKKS
jgi:hypothetical protein